MSALILQRREGPSSVDIHEAYIRCYQLVIRVSQARPPMKSKDIQGAFRAMILLLLSTHSLVLRINAQELPSPCQPRSRTDKEIVICTEWVDKYLRPVSKREERCGKRIAVYQGRYQHYPIAPVDLNERRWRTEDGCAKVIGDSLINGRWIVETEDGRLRLEDIYERGYLRSCKTYDRRGRLREWLDYSIATPEEPYRYFLQKCTWVMGKETVWEGVACGFEGSIHVLEVDYFRTRERWHRGPLPEGAGSW